jgi:hypothetical protein
LVSMPIYRFTAIQGHNACPDVRCAHLKDQEAAGHYAKLLIREFLEKSSHADLAQWRLDVKDQTGELLLSIPLQDSVANNLLCVDRERQVWSGFRPYPVGPEKSSLFLSGSKSGNELLREDPWDVKRDRVSVCPTPCGDAQYRDASSRKN